MKKNTILSIDQSTAGTKAMLFGPDGALIARCDRPHRQITNELGWVEHDPEEIYQNLLLSVRELFAQSGAAPEQVCAIGISNQRETGVMWDDTGKPVHNAVVWQCARAAALCESLERKGLAPIVKEKTGMNLSPYFTAAKFGWLLENVPEARRLAESKRLRCGTIDSWLLFKLTGQHKTDYSNASRTQLFNIQTLCWDDELCTAFGVPADSLPEVCFSDSLFGMTDMEGILPAAVPVRGVMGDSHAALFAQGCTSRGMTKATYGTGSSVMMNTENRCVRSETLVTSLAWGRGGQVSYVLEGNINYSGAVIQWLIHDLELIASPKEAAAIAAQVPSANGVYLVPAFSGLGAPYWCSEARAILCGMNRGTRKAHIVRAAEESMAYQIKDIAEAMNQAAGSALKELRTDGGPTADTVLMQFQADMLGVPVRTASIQELSGAGAAYMAGLSCGLYEEGVLYQNSGAGAYTPEMTENSREELYGGWKKAVALALSGSEKNI